VAKAKEAKEAKEVKKLMKKIVLVQPATLVQEILQEVAVEVDVDLLHVHHQLRHQIQRSTPQVRKLEVVQSHLLLRMNRRRQMPQLQLQKQRRRLRMPRRRLSY